MHDRIRLVRKAVDLSQKDFGEKLGVSRDVMANIENNRVSPGNTFLQLLCSVFNVREEWLRTGEGDMFQAEKSFSLDEYVRAHNFSDIELRILKAYLEIPIDLREKVLGYISHSFSRDSEIEREVQSYREELEIEKGAAVKSSASPDIKEA